jgi:hypothetical protein
MTLSLAGDDVRDEASRMNALLIGYARVSTYEQDLTYCVIEVGLPEPVPGVDIGGEILGQSVGLRCGHIPDVPGWR